MAIFRQYIAPLLVVLIFFAALVAVSARIFLPDDMAAPAPMEDTGISMMTQITPSNSNMNIASTAMTTTTSPPIG